MPRSHDYINAVIAIETNPAPQLLATCSDEARHGRVRSFANAPRRLDLDLLLYGDVVMQSGLEYQRRMHERASSRAAVRIAPDCVIPGPVRHGNGGGARGSARRAS